MCKGVPLENTKDYIPAQKKPIICKNVIASKGTLMHKAGRQLFQLFHILSGCAATCRKVVVCVQIY